MIKGFGVKNYFCFKEGAEVNFTFDGVAAKHTKEDVSSVLGIKGGNGSGKTNLIKAVSTFTAFAGRSAQWGHKNIPIFNHYSNNDPTEFYIDFSVDGLEYSYEVSLTPLAVLTETLYRKNKRKVLVFERLKNKVESCVRDLNEIKAIKIRSDASLISSYKNYEFKSAMKDLDRVYEVFINILSNAYFTGYRDVSSGLALTKLCESFNTDPESFDFAKKIIRKADDSIVDITIDSRFDDKGEEEYYPVFHHLQGNEKKPVFYMFEASGTKMLFKTVAYYWCSLQRGSLLCLDEFDTHLHAMILPDLVNLFLDKNINKNGAQLLFTAHNTEIIDTLGQYRTILVNKENGESYCYRLDEIPGSLIRNDRAITPLYLQRKIGGVPKDNV